MEKHNLTNEFPEFQEKIHDLKMNDAHFRNLFEEYQRVENEVRHINIGDQIAIDEYVHELKAKLLHLKDEIYSILNK